MPEKRLDDDRSIPPKQRADLDARKAQLTPAQVARFQRALHSPEGQRGRHAITPRPRSAGTPLSFAQERLWFLQQLNPGDVAYNRPVAVRLLGPLDPRRLERSLTATIARHEVLRSVFRQSNDAPALTIAPPSPFKLQMMDLTHDPVEVRDAHAHARIQEALRRPMMLNRAPLLHGTLIRLAAENHILLLCTHQIVFDAWSAGLLLRDLFATYAHAGSVERTDLPHLPIVYADYAYWQRQRFEQGEYASAIAYWAGLLRDPPDRLELHRDRRETVSHAEEGGVIETVIPEDLMTRLKALASGETASLFCALLQGLAILLGRHAGGQEDLVIATPVAGRTNVETENLIGPFVNTLALRCDLTGEPTVRELLRRTGEIVLNALEHQEAPFDKVIEALHPHRTSAQTPLASVMVNLENVPWRTVTPPNLTIEPLPLYPPAPPMDLSIEIRKESRRGWVCSALYRTSQFEPDTLERMLDHYVRLLQGFLIDPERGIEDLDMLSPGESAQLLAQSAHTEQAVPDVRADGLFTAQALRFPDAVAILCDNQLTTYGEMARLVAALSGALRDRGVRPGDAVAILLDRSRILPASILAVLGLGAAYVPLDPSAPADRLQHIIDDAQVRCLIAHKHLDPGPTFWTGARLLVGDHAFADPGAPRRTLEPAISAVASPEGVACIIYTSGSTGKPKGARLTHRGIVNHILGVYATLQVDAAATILQIPPAAFDMSIRDLIGPLTCGAKTVILTEEQRRSPLAIVEAMKAHDVTTILGIVPSLLSVLVDTMLSERVSVPSLRVVAAGGEIYPKDLARRARRAFGPSVQLYNLYGPTEATGTSTYYRIDQIAADATSIPIGRPLPNVGTYVLDDHHRLAGIGVPGELHIAGPGVANGYLNRPELTAQRFVPNPFQVGERMYKTGDIARWLASGDLEFLGRRDRQIKLRGFRIELEEVECAVREYPSVREAHVLDVKGVTGNHRLVAFVVADGPLEDPRKTFRRHLEERLPQYMVPAQFVIVESIPRTTRGKIDEASLLAELCEAPCLESAYADTRTPCEHRIAEIWRESLELERIGVHDNFFELGGHSLLALRVAGRIERTLGVRVPIRVLFDHPTVAGIAEWLDHHRLESPEQRPEGA